MYDKKRLEFINIVDCALSSLYDTNLFSKEQLILTKEELIDTYDSKTYSTDKITMDWECLD